MHANHNTKVALAAVAHPDDIEFLFAGTLLQLKAAGWDIHMWNLADGCGGSQTLSRPETARLRFHEARASADLAGATYHKPLFHDLEIVYQRECLEKVSSVIRHINPGIVLTHGLEDYMEDHVTTARLVTTACFTKGMRNARSEPPLPPATGPVALYHAPPHGLHDPYNKPVFSDWYVAIKDVLPSKCAMLACHESQSSWLQATQGMETLTDSMQAMCAKIGAQTPDFDYAEGWRQHNPLGFSQEADNPLADALGDICWERPQ